MSLRSHTRTAPVRPWAGRLLVVTLLAVAFAGWWWMLQRTLTNEQEALTGRLESELQSRFDRALNTVREGLDRDRAAALASLESSPSAGAQLIEGGRLSAVLTPEPKFSVVAGADPDDPDGASGPITWGSTAEGRDPILSTLLQQAGDPHLRPLLRRRLLGQDGPPMKASFWSRSIERYLEAGDDPVLEALCRAQAWRAAEQAPDEGLHFVADSQTLWWSQEQLLERFESAGATVTLGENGQGFCSWPTPIRAAPVVPDLADGGFTGSTGLVRWVGIGSGLLFAIVVAVSLWTGWRDRRIARLRTDLAASFAHELRTPLAGQRLLLDTLIQGAGHSPEKQAEYLRRARRANQRLGSLAEQFLTFSRLERGVLRIERRDTHVRGLVDEILASREQAFDEIVIEIPEELRAHVDHDALGSIIGNLVENAWKYGGETKWIAIRAKQDDDRLVVEVEDHGLGLDATQQDKVFRQFWRADTGLDRQVDGLGLGLTIVARLTDAHGGRIELDSTPGQGSLFRVLLPETDS